jgi:predicted nucleotidyltransferase
MNDRLAEAIRRRELVDRIRREDEAFDVTGWSLEEARRLVRECLAGTGVRAFLFGSRAWGGARTFSDIDIALDARDRPVPAEVKARVVDALEDSLILYNCDVVDLATAPLALAAEVLERGIEWTD